MYPLFFEPVYKNIIWGGRNLGKVFDRKLPNGNIAESWEVCCHKNGMSVISKGPLKGTTLLELFSNKKLEFFGNKSAALDRFPLLIKLIDANDKLSVQVHPDNKYALNAHGDLGKTEMWYIIDAKENAQLVYGTKNDADRETLKSAIETGTLEKYLNYINVKKGDVIYIPSGTVHAILDGILVAEIQQNSDTTYRVYDWNRVDSEGRGRQLHIDDALNVINFNFKVQLPEIKPIFHDGYELSNLVNCEYFIVDKISVKSSYKDKTNGETFFIYTSVEGEGTLSHNGTDYHISPGCSFLIPAGMGEFTIAGTVTLLKSYL